MLKQQFSATHNRYVRKVLLSQKNLIFKKTVFRNSKLLNRLGHVKNRDFEINAVCKTHFHILVNSHLQKARELRLMSVREKISSTFLSQLLNELFINMSVLINVKWQVTFLIKSSKSEVQ